MQRIKAVEAADMSGMLCTCKTHWYIMGMLIIITLGMLYFDVDFSYCWLNLVEAWYSLEQYIGLKEDKLSSTTVDFIRSEGNLETKHLYCFRKPKMC